MKEKRFDWPSALVRTGTGLVTVACVFLSLYGGGSLGASLENEAMGSGVTVLACIAFIAATFFLVKTVRRRLKRRAARRSGSW